MVTLDSVRDCPEKSRGPGRPSALAAYRGELAELLRAVPDSTTAALEAHLRRRGYRGGKSAVYALVAGLRDELRSASPAADVSRHVLTTVNVEFRDGGWMRTPLFASRLACSGHLAVSLLPDSSLESVCRALYAHFWRWGGIPRVAELESPRAFQDGATDRGMWSPMFSDLVVRLGLVIKDDAHAGPLAATVRRQLFTGSSYGEPRTLGAEIERAVDGLNCAARAVGSSPADRLVHERAGLRPLSSPPERLELRAQGLVDPNGRLRIGDESIEVSTAFAGLAALALLRPASWVVYVDAQRLAGKRPRSCPRRTPVCRVE